MYLNNKNTNIEKFLENSSNYNNQAPFPHTIVDGIWDNELLKKVENDINNFNNWDGEKEFFGSVGKRFCNTRNKLSDNINTILEICISPHFLKALEKITKEEGLIPDPYFEGGGIHSTHNKGFLKMHTDFNWNKKLKLYRRLNLIIFINSGWEENWGGHLNLGIKEKKNIHIYSKVLPIFNRTILFTTTESTYHGHPDFLNTPKNKSRNSIAVYYYVSRRPKGISMFKRTGTTYRKREDGKKFTNELSLKNFPRKIKSFFKLLLQK